MKTTTLKVKYVSMPVRGSSRSHREEGGTGREQASLRTTHTPVMEHEVLKALAPKVGDVVVDATFGLGGHSKALKAAAKIKLIALDADPVRAKASNGASPVITTNFADLSTVLKKLGISTIDKALFDLGWNMTQLSSGRGFSFMNDEPLNMSYGESPRSGFTAAEVLNTWSEKVLADVLYGYGEERYARRIARAIVERRAIEPFTSTLELVEVVKDAVPAAYRRGRLHPATKTFQALRIAVNDELGAIDAGVRAAWQHLSPGGRIAVITFHSIEDRAVKRLFAAWAKGGGGRLVVKKPLTATATEIKHNPPSRSAKLRVIEKL